jgi:hypothetical protein
MEISDWLASAVADAERRGLHALRPLLDTLALSTQALRNGDTAFGHPAVNPDRAKDDDGHSAK